MSADMVEQAWRIVQPVLDAWTTEEAGVPNYDSGGDGPAAADELLARDGERIWRARDDIPGADVINSWQKRRAESCPLRSLLRAFRELSHNLRFAHRKSRGPSRSACQAPHVVRPAFPASSSSVANRTRLATRDEKRGSAPLDGRRYIRLKCVELQIELLRDSSQTELPIKTGQGRLAVACFAESSCIGGMVIRHGGVSEETGKANGRR
jgi:hypothetical protein